MTDGPDLFDDDWTVDEDAVLTAALAAYDAGLCPIRPKADGTKAPLPVAAHGAIDPVTEQRKSGWELFQSERPTRAQVQTWFSAYPGVGLVCGAVSGQLEMLELEGRAVAEGVQEQLSEAVQAAGLAPVLERIGEGYTERTPSGGLHWLFRVGDGPALGSLKLAQRPATPAELVERPKSPLSVLIETKADGGFTIVAPSNGTTHPTGGSWTQEAGGFASIATVTVAERDALYAVCRTLDRLERTDEGIVKIKPAGLAQHRRYDGGPVGGSWMDAVEAHLAATDSLPAALERYGWRDLNRLDGQGCPVYERPDQEHPGQTGAVINKSGRLAVFSTSTPFESVLESRRTYNLLDVYAAYEHQGDREAAARVIAEQTGIATAGRSRFDELVPTQPVDSQLSGGDEDEDDSFEAVDLAPYLAGTAVRVKADVLTMSDGRSLLHRARLNGVHGESGTGKTWLMDFLLAERLGAGESIMLVDLEDTPDPTIERLRQIGVSDQAIATQLVFVRPEASFSFLNVERLIRQIDERDVRHVIIDSLGEAFSLEGLNEDKDVEVAPWLRRVCRVIIERTGAGMTLIDHGTKSSDKPLDPSGSKRKRAALTGTAWLMTAATPFDRATGGLAFLRCAKDRHGWFKRGDEVAAFVMGAVDPISGQSTLRLDPARSAPARGSKDMGEVIKALERVHPKGLSRRGLIAAVRNAGGKISDDRITGAVELAVAQGLAVETKGPKRARMFEAVAVSVVPSSRPVQGTP